MIDRSYRVPAGRTSVPTTIDAKFYEQSGPAIEAKFSLFGTVTIGPGSVTLNDGPVPQLQKDMTSKFPGK